MALTLRLRSGDVDPEPELPFDAPRVLIGRAPGCDLQLPDPSVSPRHASVRQRGVEYVVVDEGSENGTFVGTTRLPRHAPHALRSGDLLRFGRVWVEIRLGPAEHPVEVQASRELSRRLVDAALEADAQDYGMLVRVEGTEVSLRLAEPRHPYLVGTKRGADLKVTGPELPSRCLELRRQADQLWVTLQKGASATLGDRPLAEGERTAWAKSAVLSLGDVRLRVSDPTAQMLERLERGPTERLAEGAVVDPPSGSDADAEDEAFEEDGLEDGEASEDEAFDSEYPEQAEEEDPEQDRGVAARGGSTTGLGLGAERAACRPRRGWTSVDAVVFFLALGVLALSLWAIRWLSRMGSA